MAADPGENRDGRKDKISPGIKRTPREGLSRGCPTSRPAIEYRMPLLQKLEASLAASHRALVALDLAAIERGTADQRMLCHTIGLEMRRAIASAEDADAMENSKLSQEWKSRAWKVLRAGRLQAALLERARRKLRVMANMLAGSQRNYAAPLTRQTRLRFAVPAENRD
jgi:hypothetical protein